MAYTRDRRWQIKARRDMHKRIAEIQARTLENLDYAFDKLIQEQPDLYFTADGGGPRRGSADCYTGGRRA